MMTIEYKNFIELGLVYLFGIMLPGPSMVLLLRSSVLLSRKAGVFCALGIMLGIALQAGITLLGIAYFGENSSFLRILRVLCSLFLMYLGFKAVRASVVGQAMSITNDKLKHSWFYEGFCIEMLNPLALTFFISIFAVFVDVLQSTDLKLLAWMMIIVVGAMWFLTLALFASYDKFVYGIRRFDRALNFVSGVIFFLLSCKLLSEL